VKDQTNTKTLSEEKKMDLKKTLFILILASAVIAGVVMARGTTESPALPEEEDCESISVNGGTGRQCPLKNFLPLSPIKLQTSTNTPADKHIQPMDFQAKDVQPGMATLMQGIFGMPIKCISTGISVMSTATTFQTQGVNR